MDSGAYIRRLKERLRSDPTSKLTLSFAEELRKTDRMENAIAFLVDALRKNPDYPAARLTLGRWYLSAEMLPEARNEYMYVIEKAPDNSHAHKGLAEVHKRMGNADEAAAEYLRVLEINPADRDASLYLETLGSEARKPGNTTPALGFAGQRSSGEAIIDRLHSFLEAVKSAFSSEEVSSASPDVNQKAIDRLHAFLRAIKTVFPPDMPADAEGVVRRLNSLLEALKSGFSEDAGKGIGSF